MNVFNRGGICLIYPERLMPSTLSRDGMGDGSACRKLTEFRDSDWNAFCGNNWPSILLLKWSFSVEFAFGKCRQCPAMKLYFLHWINCIPMCILIKMPNEFHEKSILSNAGNRNWKFKKSHWTPFLAFKNIILCIGNPGNRRHCPATEQQSLKGGVGAQKW